MSSTIDRNLDCNLVGGCKSVLVDSEAGNGGVEVKDTHTTSQIRVVTFVLSY